MTRLIVLLGLVPLLALAHDLPRFFGDDTALRTLIKNARHNRVQGGWIWTHEDRAIVVALFPQPIDLRVEDLPPGRVPWRPADVSPWHFVRSEEERELLKRSSFVLVFREQDGKTCVSNQLSGERILAEKPWEQDRTTIEFPCDAIWRKLGSLGLSDSDREIISEYLKTPPASPKFKRKAK
jgi:hypothetical protein